MSDLLWLSKQAVQAAVAAAEREQGDTGDLPHHKEPRPSNPGASSCLLCGPNWLPERFLQTDVKAHSCLCTGTLVIGTLLGAHIERLCMLFSSSHHHSNLPRSGACRHLLGGGWARHSNGHGVGGSRRLWRAHRGGVEARHLPGRPHHAPCALPPHVRSGILLFTKQPKLA